MYVRLVRGNPDYGINNLVDNGDGTISDIATDLCGRGILCTDITSTCLCEIYPTNTLKNP